MKLKLPHEATIRQSSLNCKQPLESRRQYRSAIIQLTFETA